MISRSGTETNRSVAAIPPQEESILALCFASPAFLMHEVPFRVIDCSQSSVDSEYQYHTVRGAQELDDEWLGLKNAIESLRGRVHLVHGCGTPDDPAIFAVQDVALALPDEAGEVYFVLCNFTIKERASEISYLARDFCRLSPQDPFVVPEDAHLEGGDVVRIGKLLFVRAPDGEGRSDEPGVLFLERIAGALGYNVVRVRVDGFQHLTHVCSWAGPDPSDPIGERQCVVLDSNQVDPRPFSERGIKVINVKEDFSAIHPANVLPIMGHLIIQEGAPELERQLLMTGFKAENLIRLKWTAMDHAHIGFTCCCIALNHDIQSLRGF